MAQVKLSPSDAPESVVTVSTDVANMSVTIRNMLEGSCFVPGTV